MIKFIFIQGFRQPKTYNMWDADLSLWCQSKVLCSQTLTLTSPLLYDLCIIRVSGLEKTVCSNHQNVVSKSRRQRWFTHTHLALWPYLETHSGENHILALFEKLLSSCLHCVFVHHLSVFVTHPRDSEQQEVYDRAEEPHVDRSETLPLWQRPKQEPVTAWSHLSDSSDRITRHQGSCAKAYMHSLTHMMRGRGQKFKKWDATCICSVSVFWMVLMSGIHIAPYFSRDCNGADPSLSLHFTCFMVNKSSQDFGGLVST